MRLVVQRVSSASVEVDGKTVGSIGQGLLILLGVQIGDSPAVMEWGARKVADLRIFQDSQDKMNLSLKEIGGSALVISQFTLFGDAQKGRRPSFTQAAPPEEAKRLYEMFKTYLAGLDIPMQAGIFAARMSVKLVNEGPVTILLDRDPNSFNVA